MWPIVLNFLATGALPRDRPPSRLGSGTPRTHSHSSGVTRILTQEGHSVRVYEIRQKSYKFLHKYNKCIGDDTKAAARQSLNCIKYKKITYGEKRFSIWRMEFLHSAMWHVALESWHWIHQVAVPCNVIRGSGMTCHWIRPNVRHIGISIFTQHRSRHVILHQSPKFYRNRTTLGRKKWCHVDFQDGGSQPSWIVGVQ